MPSPAAQNVQVAIAIVAVLGCAALALWRVRRWTLLAALLSTAFSGAVWMWLLVDMQNC